MAYCVSRRDDAAAPRGAGWDSTTGGPVVRAVSGRPFEAFRRRRRPWALCLLKGSFAKNAKSELSCHLRVLAPQQAAHGWQALVLGDALDRLS